MSGQDRRRTAILVSGRGSNMQSLIEAAAAPDFPAEIVLVLSSRADAPALARAEAAGIATATVSAREHRDRAAREAVLARELAAAKADLVCLAGYMHILSPEFVRQWHGRMLNIHPSLLPAFKGLDSHARAIAAGCRIHGASVHFVTAEMDGGPIIAQAAVPVLAADSAECLGARVLAAEHRLYPQALRLVAAGMIGLEGDVLRHRAIASDPDQLILSSG